MPLGTEQQRELDKQIIELYNDGYSIDAISKTVYWSRNYCRNRLIVNKVTMRDRSVQIAMGRRPSISKLNEAAYWAKKGLNHKEIAMKMDLHPQTVGSYLRRTQTEKPARTHCKNGHRFTPKTIYRKANKNGYVCIQCRTCRHNAHKRWLEKNNQKNNEQND